MTSMQMADMFFSSKAAVLAGQSGGAVELAQRVSAALGSAGLRVEPGYNLERDPVLVFHMGVLYGEPYDPLGTLEGVDDLLARARQMRNDCPQVPRGVQAPLPVRAAAQGTDLLLPGQAEAAAELPPLVGRAFTLARCGELVWGNWWLRSVDAEKFVLAGDFGFSPPARARPAEESFVIEVWPAGASGQRLTALKDGSAPSTTMLHVPFGGAARLRLVDADPISSARRRTDENLRRVFS